jgi:hypothetical protein
MMLLMMPLLLIMPPLVRDYMVARCCFCSCSPPTPLPERLLLFNHLRLPNFAIVAPLTSTKITANGTFITPHSCAFACRLSFNAFPCIATSAIGCRE